VFVTNAGNELRSAKAAKLSQILGIPVGLSFSNKKTKIDFI